MFVTFQNASGRTVHVRADRVVWVTDSHVMVDDGSQGPFTLACDEDAGRIVRDVRAALAPRPFQAGPPEPVGHTVAVTPADGWTGPPTVHEEREVGLKEATDAGGLACHKSARDQYREGPCRRPAGHDGDCRP